MSLTLHAHPLSSFCWKALVGLYETATPFEFGMLELGDPEAHARFTALWPVGRMPVLEDAARGVVVPETTVILDYLDAFYPGPVRFTPTDADAAWRTRLWDRFFDNYLQHPMQKIIADILRPEDARDPYGVAEARAQIAASYAVLEAELSDGRTWAVGEAFGLADCAACPALYYADRVAPLGEAYPKVAAYSARLQARPSFARVLDEAQPYMAMFPG